jgi:hypothetical protein
MSAQIHIQGFKNIDVTCCGLNAKPGDKLHTTAQPRVATCLSCLAYFDDRAEIRERIVRLRTARANA